MWASRNGASRSARHVPARLGAAATAVASLLMTGCGGGDGTSSASPTSSSATVSPSPSSPTTESPNTTTTPPAGQLTGIPVYWVGESRKEFRLYREFRTVPRAGGVAASAVSAMMRLQPLDPDYQTPWRPPTRLRVTQTSSAITVDLSRDAFANTNVGSELAERAVQQLVYTATSAAHVAGHDASTVTITVDGASYDAWGVVQLGSPMRRAPMLQVQGLVWVVSPQQGGVRPAGQVSFTGYGTSFEATFAWKVTGATGAVVAHGSAMGGTGTGGFGTFRFAARLGAGTYTVQAGTDNPSGSALGPATDDKKFTVR